MNGLVQLSFFHTRIRLYSVDIILRSNPLHPGLLREIYRSVMPCLQRRTHVRLKKTYLSRQCGISVKTLVITVVAALTIYYTCRNLNIACAHCLDQMCNHRDIYFGLQVWPICRGCAFFRFTEMKCQLQS